MLKKIPKCDYSLPLIHLHLLLFFLFSSLLLPLSYSSLIFCSLVLSLSLFFSLLPLPPSPSLIFLSLLLSSSFFCNLFLLWNLEGKSFSPNFAHEENEENDHQDGNYKKGHCHSKRYGIKSHLKKK